MKFPFPAILPVVAAVIVSGCATRSSSAQHLSPLDLTAAPARYEGQRVEVEGRLDFGAERRGLIALPGRAVTSGTASWGLYRSFNPSQAPPARASARSAARGGDRYFLI